MRPLERRLTGMIVVDDEISPGADSGQTIFFVVAL